jgi:hypothetical protein
VDALLTMKSSLNAAGADRRRRLFGNRAVSSETLGFAPPPRGGFAFFEPV